MNLLQGTFREDAAKVRRAVQKLEPRLRKVTWTHFLVGGALGLALGAWLSYRSAINTPLARALRLEGIGDDVGDDEET